MAAVSGLTAGAPVVDSNVKQSCDIDRAASSIEEQLSARDAALVLVDSETSTHFYMGLLRRGFEARASFTDFGAPE